MAAKDIQNRPAPTASRRTKAERSVSEQAPQPRVKASKRELPQVASLKRSLTSARREKQLALLEQMANLPTPDSFPKDSKQIREHDQPLPGIHMLVEIAALDDAVLKTTHVHLRTRELVQHGLQALACTDEALSVWSKAERSAFSAMLNEPLARQRGQLRAMNIFEASGLKEQVPEATADALRCLLFDADPSSWHANRLLSLRHGHEASSSAHYAKQQRDLEQRLVQIGLDSLIKPLFARRYPDPVEQQRELARIQSDKSEVATIVGYVERIKEQRSLGVELSVELSLVLDKLERLWEAIEQFDSDHLKAELEAMDQQLQMMLLEHLPPTVQTQIKATQSREEDRQIETLLRTPVTMPTQLLKLLGSDAQRIEALQILWGDAPVYCLRFARQLSELLRLAGPNAHRFLADLEAQLLAQLEPARLGDYERLAREHEGKLDSQGQPWNRVTLIVNRLERLLAPPNDSNDELSPAEASYPLQPTELPFTAITNALQRLKQRALRVEASTPKQTKKSSSKTAPPPLLQTGRQKTLTRNWSGTMNTTTTISSSLSASATPPKPGPLRVSKSDSDTGADPIDS